MPPRARSEPPPTRSHPTPGSLSTVLWTVVAVTAALAVGWPWLTPLIVTAPFGVFIARRSDLDPGTQSLFFRRWAVTLFVTTALATAFAPAHAHHTVPMAGSVPLRIDEWLNGGAGPPLGARYMIALATGFVAATAISGGLFGAVVYSFALMLEAVYASHYFSMGFNVAQVALIAISPWQWFWLLGLAALFVPASAASRRHVLRRGGEPLDWHTHRRRGLVGLGLILTAFVLRLTCAGWYASMVTRWTLY